MPAAAPIIAAGVLTTASAAFAAGALTLTSVLLGLGPTGLGALVDGEVKS